MMTTASSNQTSLPSVHFPDVPCGSLTPDQHSLYFLATWRKGGVQRSGTFGEFIRDACHRRDPSGLNSKMVASPELATCEVLATAQRRSGRRPDLMGAAQHPGIERRAIIPAASQFIAKQPATTAPACSDPRPTRANGDVHEKIACGLGCDSSHR
jgi:hypothetical protein